MALVREKDGKRLHVKSALMGESLVSKEFIEQLDIAPQERLYPDVSVMKIGGQSICDRGAKALPAILKEIVANAYIFGVLLQSHIAKAVHLFTIYCSLRIHTGCCVKS